MKVIRELVGYFERRGKLTEKQIGKLLTKGFLASDAPRHMVAHCEQVGQTHYFHVTGEALGTVWGSDVYTGDSALGAAAMHAGIVAEGETKVVRVTVVEPLMAYEGTTRNGVTTHSYGYYGTAYRVEGV